MDKKFWFKLDRDKIKVQLREMGKIFSRRQISFKNGAMVILFFALIGIGFAIYYNDSLNEQLETNPGITVEPLGEEREATEEMLGYYHQSVEGETGFPRESDPRPKREATVLQDERDEQIAGVVTEPINPLEEPVSRSLTLLKPVDGEIIQESGWYFHPVFDDWRYQSGLEFKGEAGNIVMAAAAGRIISVKEDQYKGILVKIEHENGWQTLYGHLQKAVVSIGENVARGQEIGRLGSSGMAAQPSLYFGLETQEGAINPTDYIN